MGDRYIITVTCQKCSYIDNDVYYAPSCGFTQWTCPQCHSVYEIEEQQFTLIPRVVSVNSNAYYLGTRHITRDTQMGGTMIRKHKMDESYDYALFAWVIDFLRCVEEMPTWRKLLIYVVLGKYAAREYVGIREHLDEQYKNQSQFGYGLEKANYHRERWNWLKRDN